MSDRVGLLGGTFNPVHAGHIELGLRLKEAFSLKRILYILSARPPHKKLMAMPPADLRLAMLQQALAPYPGLEVSDLEVRRPDFSWTFSTIQELRGVYPEDTFFFISGSEGFLKIKTWKNYRQIFEEVYFIVVLRSPYHLRSIQNLLRAEGIPFFPDARPLPARPAVFIHRYQSETLSLSSTLIRRLVKSRKDIGPLVAPEVKRIMEDNHIYEN